MEKVIKTSLRKKLKTIGAGLLAIAVVAGLIHTCKDPNFEDSRLFWIIFMSLVSLGGILRFVDSILTLYDTVTLTDKTIKLHLHPLSFPSSVKPVDAEFQWKDIKYAYFDEGEHYVILCLKLTSGKFEDFHVAHLDSSLKTEIKFYLGSRLKEEEEDEEPIIYEWNLGIKCKSRGTIRVDNLSPKQLQKRIDSNKGHGQVLPDSIKSDGTSHILTFENIEFEALCDWIMHFASSEAKGWFTLGDLSDEPDLKDLSNQTVMLFVPGDNWDYDELYLVAPDGECYTQEFTESGSLSHNTEIQQEYQEAPW